MKALIHEGTHPSGSFPLRLRKVADPQSRETDLLVEVRAVGVNPGEAKMLSMQAPEPERRRIFGWEFAGVVARTGSQTHGFKVGDHVYGSGDISRDGCYAELLAVDHRVVGHLPDSASFSDAAALPVGLLVCFESLFREKDALPAETNHVLIIGAAGGTGSVATQLLKARSSAFVIATASREESRLWCQRMGADLVVDHTRDVRNQLKDAGIEQVDLVYSTAQTTTHLPWIAEVLRPFGDLCVIDVAGPFDVSSLVAKSASIRLEMVFSKVMHQYKIESVASALNAVAGLLERGEIRPPTNKIFHGLTEENMEAAHALLLGGRVVGKIVIEF